MDKLLNGIHECMNERGITDSKYRIKIIKKEIIGNSDWAYITVDIYQPRKRKPIQCYKLAINFVRNIINWEKSSFNYYSNK